MKKLIAFVVFFVSVNVLAQRKDSILAVISRLQNTPTATGKPDGEPVSQKIGKEGGTLVSSDNKITLIIPPGALLSKTLIRIQPTTSFAQECIGKAYQFEPSGIQFQKPVQLVFHYTDKETRGQSPRLMGVGWQNEKGIWRGLRKINLDPFSKTITADIKHFSSFLLWWALILETEKTRLKVSNEMNVFLYERLLENDPLAEPSEQILNEGFSKNINWSVNGIPGGNSEVGLIQAYEGAPPTVDARLYIAPAQLPDNNPVEIKVDFTDIKFADPNPNIPIETYPNTSRNGNVLIYDNAYEVIMESCIKSGNKYAWGGIKTTLDLGRFTVELGKNKPGLTQIVNSLELMDDDCKNIILNPTTCTGILHVAGVEDIKITPASPPAQPYPIVEVKFSFYPIEFSKVKFNCPPPPGGTKDRSKGAQQGKFDMPNVGRALPWDIKFIAKDEKQIIIPMEETDEGWLYIWVRQVKD